MTNPTKHGVVRHVLAAILVDASGRAEAAQAARGNTGELPANRI